MPILEMSEDGRDSEDIPEKEQNTEPAFRAYIMVGTIVHIQPSNFSLASPPIKD